MIGPGLIPVHLRLVAQRVALRHERLALDQAHRALAGTDVVAHRRLSDPGIRKLRQDPTIDPPRRMSLLARRPTILVQHLVDERRDRVQLRLDPRRVTTPRRQRTGNRLPHHPPMHAELRRNTGDRADAKLMLLTKLLEQFHFGVPIHSEPPGRTGETLG